MRIPVSGCARSDFAFTAERCLRGSFTTESGSRAFAISSTGGIAIRGATPSRSVSLGRQSHRAYVGRLLATQKEKEPRHFAKTPVRDAEQRDICTFITSTGTGGTTDQKILKHCARSATPWSTGPRRESAFLRVAGFLKRRQSRDSAQRAATGLSGDSIRMERLSDRPNL